MKITVNFPDQIVVVDGAGRNCLTPIVQPSLPGAPLVRAAQWDGQVGFYEIESVSGGGLVWFDDVAQLDAYVAEWTASEPVVPPPVGSEEEDEE